MGEAERHAALGDRALSGGGHRDRHVGSTLHDPRGGEDGRIHRAGGVGRADGLGGEDARAVGGFGDGAGSADGDALRDRLGDGDGRAICVSTWSVQPVLRDDVVAVMAKGEQYAPLVAGIHCNRNECGALHDAACFVDGDVDRSEDTDRTDRLGHSYPGTINGFCGGTWRAYADGWCYDWRRCSRGICLGVQRDPKCHPGYTVGIGVASNAIWIRRVVILDYPLRWDGVI